MARFHRLDVGDIACAVIHEGGGGFPIADIAGRYTNATDNDVVAALNVIGASQNDVVADLNCLYIKSGDDQIMVDAGFGDHRAEPLGQAVPSLRAAGIDVETINIVFVSHFHGDHIIGLINQAGDPTFPSARHITTQTEWDYWMDLWRGSDDDHQQQMARMMTGLESTFSFVGEGDEIAKGVRVVDAPGHTPGHSGLLVESGGDSLLALVDLLHHAAQFVRPDWHFKFDTDGVQGEATRKRLLRRCADEGLLTLFYHLAFPGLGHVDAAGDVFRWRPIED